MLDGKARAMGLGPLHTLSLAEAREQATHCRKLTRQGLDPIEARKAERTKARLEAAKSITFDGCATRCIAGHKSGWRNSKHAEQWRSTLDTYAKPIFGTLPVQDIDLTLVLKVLEPIWRTKTETASRLRGRIEAILDWATVRGYRQGDNPARWRGHLDKVLPARSKVQKVAHHEALPFSEIRHFLALLRSQERVAAEALEFLILTAARTGEVIGARWDELDLAQEVWTVPADRMKAGREHRVPLSTAAIGVLEAMKKLRRDDYVFPGLKKGKPLWRCSSYSSVWEDPSDGARVSVRRFATGRQSGPISLVRSPRWLLPTPSRQGGSGLPSWRSVREEARADGHMGSLLRRDSTLCRRTPNCGRDWSSRRISATARDIFLFPMLI